MFLCKVNPKKGSRISKKNHDSHIWNPHNTYPCSTVVHGTCLATVIEAQSCKVSKFEEMNLVLGESTTSYIVTSNFLDVSNIPIRHEDVSVNFLQHDKTCRQIYHAWMLCKPFVPITNGSTLDEK